MSRRDSPEMLVLKDVEHELGCRPDGGVAAVRALKARVAELEAERIDVRAIRCAIECALLPNGKCVYLSHPVTTGGRSMAENVKNAASLAACLRESVKPVPVINPTGIGHIPGWTHDVWMELWLPFVRDRVSTLVLAPHWETSTGCRLEEECARKAGVLVVGFSEFAEQRGERKSNV